MQLDNHKFCAIESDEPIVQRVRKAVGMEMGTTFAEDGDIKNFLLTFREYMIGVIKPDAVNSNNLIMHIQFAGEDNQIIECYGNDMTIDVSKKRLIPLLHLGDLNLESPNNHFQLILSFSNHYLPRKVISAETHCDVLCDAV